MSMTAFFFASKTLLHDTVLFLIFVYWRLQGAKDGDTITFGTFTFGVFDFACSIFVFFLSTTFSFALPFNFGSAGQSSALQRKV